MDAGKEKCEILKGIRKNVAEQYGLEYSPAECTHKGACRGTCPQCEAELADLQRQLNERGIVDVKLDSKVKVPKKSSFDIMDVFMTEGLICRDKPEKEKFTFDLPGLPALEGDVSFMPSVCENRKLFKEVCIEGLFFDNLDALWGGLRKGDKLSLVRMKGDEHDYNAVLVTLLGDNDGTTDDFSFKRILGNVPRADSEFIATVLDMGWNTMFECEISRVEGATPGDGCLYMNIYIVSKEHEETVPSGPQLRLLKLDDECYNTFKAQLENCGCAYFRFGGYPLSQHVLPEVGERVIFMYECEKRVELYMMYCKAVGDEMASHFIDEADMDMLHAVDDCCFYIFTIISGPQYVDPESISFIDAEPVGSEQPDCFLSVSATDRINSIFNTKPDYSLSWEGW